jgi:hypothetical protein
MILGTFLAVKMTFEVLQTILRNPCAQEKNDVARQKAPSALNFLRLLCSKFESRGRIIRQNLPLTHRRLSFQRSELQRAEQEGKFFS